MLVDTFRFVDRNEDVFIEYSLIHDGNICLQETVTRRGSTIEHIFGICQTKKMNWKIIYLFSASFLFDSITRKVNYYCSTLVSKYNETT